jgi:uncharacterized protein (UPF0335 family)
VSEFIERYLNIENELSLLQEDRKSLFEEFKEKLDLKALRAAIRIAKIKSKLGDSESEMETMLGPIEEKLTV